MKRQITIFSIAIFLLACKSNKNNFDASGTFEAEEVIVSAEISGKLMRFTAEEGQTLAVGESIGNIDAENLSLQKQQVEESIKALQDKTVNAGPQVALLQNQQAVQQTELDRQVRERGRTENLIKADAATGKQLDDVNAQIKVLRKQIAVTQQQINVQKSNTQSQNRSILSEGKPLEKRAAQLNDQLKRANIINPVGGTVLAKYAEAGEVTSAGKALYKIADLSTLTLRAYITGSQLSEVKLNQQVTVRMDKGKDAYKEAPGTLTWISDKAEFTPKTIQTKEERANLVYAVKIRVKNDGYLKIGMYGEVLFNAK